MKKFLIFGAITAVLGYTAWKIIKDITKSIGNPPDYTYDDDIIDNKPKK
jgi:hypothetical protein